LDNGFDGDAEDWLASLIGPQGLPGVNGAAGATGAQGIQGPEGVPGTNGTNGTNGLSAYEIAVANHFEGTIGQWLLSLKGTNGTDGEDGEDGTPGMSGWERISVTSASDSINKTATATCTGSKKIIGGGGSLSIVNGKVMISSNIPSADNQWSVTGTETSTENGVWTVTAYAICATVQ
jgi:integrin beta 8